MAGIYVHIPFCRSRCIYCGFYSTTLDAFQARYVEAVCREWAERRAYLRGEPADTIYIGGGTPSVLSEQLFRRLFGAIGTAAEVTVECNPDDVDDRLPALLAGLGVNRVSMGAQTFSDERLRFIGRRHTALQVGQAVERLRRAGIGNISIDLMYGFPGETLADWQADIDAALSLQATHLSAYALMYEEGTPLCRLLQQGRVSEVDEELSRQMFERLAERLAHAGYEHYEISNFALPGRRSRHNSSYWNQTPYIGLGAAAHSYDGQSREWNVADVKAYIEGMEQGCRNYEREELDADTRYNDLVLTALRTREGLPLALLDDAHRRYCLRMARPYIADGRLLLSGETLRLSREGIFVSNMIMADLMWV